MTEFFPLDPTGNINNNGMFSFDFYDQSNIPNFSLANPDGTVIYNLGTIYDREVQLRYNAFSTLTFTAPSIVDGVEVDYYPYLQYRRLVLVDTVGNFMITKVELENNGLVELKKITCQSLEIILASKKISLFSGTYNFYSSDSPTGTLLSELITYVPGWTLGDIDVELEGIYRNFDVTDKTLYDFMVNEVSQTYQCVFVFDSINKTISAHTLDNATTSTDIFISFDNLMQNFKISESADEVVTALTVLGGEDLSINTVNPIGTNIIYNFDYYKTTAWMTQDLIDALNIWEAKVDLYQPTYADLLTDLKVCNAQLLDLQAQLATLQAELSALYGVRDVRIQQGLDTAPIDTQITEQLALINITEIAIADVESVISVIQAQLTTINTDLLFENNFTAIQLSSLNNFIIENTYTNTNFIQTSIMTPVEIQESAQTLYDQGVTVLAKISQPRYTFEIDSANFLFLKDFEYFATQIEMGCVMTVEITDGVYIQPVLLGIDFSYDDPAKFKMTLSNRLRLDDGEFQYSDLFSTMVDSATTTHFNSQKWNAASAAYTSISGSTTSSVLTTGLSSASNIALFSDSTGIRIKDGGVMYVDPTLFTPSLYCVDATFTYGVRTGIYTIIGRVCTFELTINISTIVGTASGTVIVLMPINCRNANDIRSVFPLNYNTLLLDAGYYSVIGVLEPNTNNCGLYQQGNASTTELLASNIQPGAHIYMSGSYIID